MRTRRPHAVLTLARLTLVALLALGLSGCFKATFVDGRHPATADERSAYRSHFLFGIVGDTEVDVRDYCASGEAQQVRTASSLGTMLITVFTVGIYTPRMVYFTCAPQPGDS